VLLIFISGRKDGWKKLNLQIFFISLKKNVKTFINATMACFFQSQEKIISLKRFLFLIFLFAFSFVKAQKVDSIYVHLYTDSLKKGTYNYINIDGKLANGKFLPLDTSDILFSSSDGKFYGNSLYIDPDFSKEKVNIKAVLKSNPSVYKQFDIYIKKIPNPTKLKTLDEILNEPKKNRKKI
jgi:hypothetical protein